MTFKDLGLNDRLLSALNQKGYIKPSQIQDKAIPIILEGHDLLGSAQTGSGKTAAFVLPLLNKLLEIPLEKSKRHIRALIITPTRELAAQVHQSVVDYGSLSQMRSTVIFGGVNANPQIATLRSGVDVLVATPGRLLDLQSQKALSLSKVEFLVLDEADRMLDMGFARDLNKIVGLLPQKRQNLLFSATFSKEIKALANKFLNFPKQVEVNPSNSTVETVNQEVIRVDKSRKTALIIHLIKEGDWKQVLIFTRTKHGANKLCKKMIQSGISAAAIHGNKSQNARTKALADFKNGSVKALVATDIAARGLDIPLLPYVVNFELPNVPEDYVHRIGRTGRAGAEGKALSLVSGDEKVYLKDIEKLIDQRISSSVHPGFELDPSIVYKAIKKPGRSGNSRKKPSSFKKRPNTFR